MGPMGPRGLGPWALWAPGTLGPNFEDFQNLTKVAPKDPYLIGVRPGVVLFFVGSWPWIIMTMIMMIMIRMMMTM